MDSSIFLILAVIAATHSKNVGYTGTPFDTSQCSSSLPESVVTEIQKYQSVAKDIFMATTEGVFRGRTYRTLEYMADTFGPRPSGSNALDSVLDYILGELKKQGLSNVRAEKVELPKVTRGPQFGLMIEPRIQEIELVALGFSVSTSALGIIAEIIVISSREFFWSNKNSVLGKIVVVDFPLVNRGGNIDILSAMEESGAVAILFRAVVSFSIYSLAQARGMRYRKIPMAIATNEDVDLFVRLTKKREYNVKLKIVIINEVTMTKSRNIMAELPGQLKPEELILVGCHTDTWHFSQGAQDNGIGMALALETPRLLRKLNLIPKRSVRPVFWTGEELGVVGSRDYVKTHANELTRHSAVLEAERSCFKPLGYLFGNTSPQFGCILNEIMKLQNDLIPTNFLHTGDGHSMPTDIRNFVKLGVPAANLYGNDGRYFWYHHTKADTLSIVNSKELDRCLAFLATTTYILADMKDMVPRT